MRKAPQVPNRAPPRVGGALAVSIHAPAQDDRGDRPVT